MDKHEHPAAVFNMLAGSWTFTRHIPGQATVEGSARFVTIDSQRLAYEENACVLMVRGGTHRARQRYVYVRTAGGLEVWFAGEPQRLFHAIDLHRTGERWTGNATHACGNDTYDSRYSFAVDGRSFNLRHVVNGPRKNYVSITVYRADFRAADQPLG